MAALLVLDTKEKKEGNLLVFSGTTRINHKEKKSIKIIIVFISEIIPGNLNALRI